MAKSIAEWEQILLNEKAAHTELDALNSTSVVAIWRLFIYLAAVCAWTLDVLFDLFKKDVDSTISKMKPHSPEWYVEMAKKFQYGFSLVPEKDYYDNTGIADDVVAASKIIAYAAVIEVPSLRMKLAKKVGSNLAKLSNIELPAAVAYIERYKGLGVFLNSTTVTSTDPDELYFEADIYFDPLVLDINGARLDLSTATPVQDGIKNYLVNKSATDFNGVFSTQKFVDNIQAVEGVTDLNVKSIMTKYGALPFTSFNTKFLPDSGYLIIQDVNLILNFIPA